MKIMNRTLNLWARVLKFQTQRCYSTSSTLPFLEIRYNPIKRNPGSLLSKFFAIYIYFFACKYYMSANTSYYLHTHNLWVKKLAWETVPPPEDLCYLCTVEQFDVQLVILVKLLPDGSIFTETGFALCVSMWWVNIINCFSEYCFHIFMIWWYGHLSKNKGVHLDCIGKYMGNAKMLVTVSVVSATPAGSRHTCVLRQRDLRRPLCLSQGVPQVPSQWYAPWSQWPSLCVCGCPSPWAPLLLKCSGVGPPLRAGGRQTPLPFLAASLPPVLLLEPDLTPTGTPAHTGVSRGLR